ncbi:DUF3261 domain-containing protein [Cupriavidus malaysiensis]|uniref:DUF3261 domain-containing protein n=1 Tax=Cupriavidus malaysiensis TaxID=367825 RepID=A0ABN4TWH4_9BURK|nr:DUF3261 domain-containing protein [Cupriavidus malaysiensis]AOZ09810.1 hypothetical protein BKK80_29365 [Cupriavidus malaysiensis]
MRRLSPDRLAWRDAMPALVSALVTAWVSAGCGTSAPPAASPAVAAASPAPAAAAAAAPLLRLAPAALGRTLAWQQQIRVRFRDGAGADHVRELQALLEADAGTTRLAALAGGQVLARLAWDGTRLQVSRSPWAPAELMPERILSDLQLALWPSAAVAAALPPGWTLAEGPGWRELRQGAEAVVAIGYPGDPDNRGDRLIALAHRRDGFTLEIRNLAAAPAGDGVRP